MGSAISAHCSRRRSPPDKIPLEKAIGYIKHSPFNQYLQEETINEFAKCFQRQMRSPSGSRFDLDSQTIYIVAEGEIDLSTVYPDHVKVEATGYLCRKRAGDIINLKHTKEDAQRKAAGHSHKINDLVEEIIVTGCGEDDILLLCADMKELETFISSHQELSKIIASITTTQIEDKLLQIPFLKPIPPSKISVLAAMCRYEAFDSQQTVFEQDDKADKFYLVLRGVVRVIAKEAQAHRGLHAMVSKKNNLVEKRVTLQRSLECSCTRQTLLHAEDVVIADLTSGDYYGETALVFDIDRTCKVKTMEKSLFLTVHKKDFKNFLNICPIEDRMKSVIKQRLLSKLSTLGIPFLTGIPQEMYTSLTDSVAIDEVPKDDVIFRQGDIGDKFYIVVHGGVQVSTNADSVEDENEESEEVDDESTTHVRNESRLGTLAPGQYFGEMALVNAENNLRTATVTSTQKSILLSIDKESFQTIFGSNLQVLAEFELRVLKNRAQLCHILKHSLGLASFREFIEKEHAGENIDFWVAATNFALEFAQFTKEENLAKAKQLYLTFCAEYADRQINIPHNMKLELDNNIQADAISPNIFDAALSEIYKLMEKDNFRRYKSSNEFQQFFARLGILY